MNPSWQALKGVLMYPFTSVEIARGRRADALADARRRRLLSAGGMPRRSRRRRDRERIPAAGDGDFFAWVLSLPWVVERPYELAPGVRSFAVDCPPLSIRRVWLVTGLGASADGAMPVSVIVPRAVSSMIENAGWGRRMVDLPADHVLMGVDARDASADVEALVLTGYRYAMA
jgi:hypothetical protein